jgi:hypothetical protein
MCSCELVASDDLISFIVPLRLPDWDTGCMWTWPVPVPPKALERPLLVVARLFRLLEDVSWERPLLANTSREARMSMLEDC